MRSCRSVALAVAVALLVPVVAGAQGTLGDQLAAKFQQTLDRLARDARGVAGVSVVDLTSGRRWEVNGTTVFPQGSAIKIALLIEPC